LSALSGPEGAAITGSRHHATRAQVQQAAQPGEVRVQRRGTLQAAAPAQAALPPLVCARDRGRHERVMSDRRRTGAECRGAQARRHGRHAILLHNMARQYHSRTPIIESSKSRPSQGGDGVVRVVRVRGRLQVWR
jgi:hypothetical protein